MARLKAGLTLQQAGELVGVALNTIWRYEADSFKPSGPAFAMLCQAYKKPAEWFIGEWAPIYNPGINAAGFGGKTAPYNVPVVGTVSAGGMVESWGEDLGYVPVTWELLRRAPNAKALRVSGRSLESERIFDGDIVILDPDQKTVEDGRLYAIRSEEYNQTTAARKVYIVGSRRLKLVSGNGDVVEVDRSRTVIEGRIIQSYSVTEH